MASRAGAQRVMLTGPRVAAGWFIAKTPGWAHGSHHLDASTPVGRYVHQTTGQRVEIRRASEWFGQGDYTAEQARAGWEALTKALALAIPGMDQPLGSPGATGREAWLRSRTFDKDTRQPIDPPQCSLEVAELLHATSGQHRIERFAKPEHDLGENRLWLLDGRLMYAACVRELGVGGTLLGAREANEHFLANPYGRARYQVKVTVPEWWDTCGILPYRADPGDPWEYPAEPGRTFTTWADSSEVWLAAWQFAWPTEVLAGIGFEKGKPLDTWAARLLRAYDAASVTLDPSGPLVRAGIRWMLLHSIGAWHSTGRTETTITDSPMHQPAGDGWGPPQPEKGQALWRRRAPLVGRSALMAHPEWSSQVWGRARARVLWAPTRLKDTHAGALTIPSHQLVSIYGDAIMVTERPPWAYDFYDDGKPGRLRVKGHLPNLEAAGGWPATSQDRDKLMHQAEAYGQPLQEIP